MRGYLSLGSNMGDRMGYLQKALDKLSAEGIRLIRISGVYETIPVDVPDAQRNYYNLVAYVETDLDPEELLCICAAIEKDLGRERKYVHAPRTIDIDIILLEGVTVSTPKLTVPHPRMEQRSFVIFPLSEISPDIVLASGRPIIEVKKSLHGDEIVKVQALNHG